MSANLTLPIPVWLDLLFTWPVLLYRRIRFGYTFRRIYLGEGEWTILDVQDYYKYAKYKWSLGGNGQKYYAVRGTKNKDNEIEILRLHRLILPPPPGLIIDHRNGKGLDNRRTNLRPATQSQNMQNRKKRKNSTSKFIGVWFVKAKNRWESSITYQKKRIFLGRFKSEIEAARAYDRAALKYHKDFARLNFPLEEYINEIKPS